MSELTEKQIEDCRKDGLRGDFSDEKTNALCDMAQRCRKFEEHAILREDWMPEWATEWRRIALVGPQWVSEDGAKSAPDIRPNSLGPLLIVG